MANRVVTRITTFTEVSILQLAAMGPDRLFFQLKITQPLPQRMEIGKYISFESLIK